MRESGYCKGSAEALRSKREKALAQKQAFKKGKLKLTIEFYALEPPQVRLRIERRQTAAMDQAEVVNVLVGVDQDPRSHDIAAFE